MLIPGTASRIELRKTTRAALLVHGLRGVPNIFDGLTPVLAEAGISFYNIRLTGHGFSTPEQMLGTRETDWEKQVENVFLDLCDAYEEVILIGLSLGAALALKVALAHNFNGKVILLAPFLQFKQKYGGLLGLLGCFVKKLPPKKSDCSQEDPVFTYFMPAFTLPQLYEAYKLIRKVRKNLPRIKARVLCFTALQDHALDPQVHLKLTGLIPRIEQVILEKSYHNILQDVEKEAVIHKIISWLAAGPTD